MGSWLVEVLSLLSKVNEPVPVPLTSSAMPLLTTVPLYQS
jgi:hypothetical protein